MKNLFTAVTGRLDGIPAIKWADEDKGQMNFEKPPVLFPCALVDIQYPKPENLNAKIQNVEAVVTVRLAFDFTGSTHSKTPEAARSKSLAFYDVVESVYKAFQGWETSEFNPFSRRGFYQEKRPDGYKVVSMMFTTHFRDTGAV